MIGALLIGLFAGIGLGLFVALHLGAGWLAAAVTAVLSANLVALAAALLLNSRRRQARQTRLTRRDLTSR